MSLAGHLWTIGAFSTRGVNAPAVRSELRKFEVPDPRHGSVSLSGQLSGLADGWGDVLVVLLHGLGGSAESPYLAQAAAACADRRWSTLRLNLRGADGSGEDYYHAGLSADLHAVSADSALASFQHLLLLGFSLGGHLLLRAATESRLDPRIRAVAAVSSPLELEACCRVIDRPSCWPYRSYMLRRLVELYATVAERRDVPLPVEDVRRVRRLRDFDHRVVAPRFGFESAEDYYARASVGPRLKQLRIPALYVGSRQDPMVPASAVDPFIASAGMAGGGQLIVRWQRRGGHVAFSRDLDLGEPGPQGVYRQVSAWLGRYLPGSG